MGQKKLVRKAEPPSKRRIRWPRWTGFRGKTVWDWMALLIVPLALVVIGLLFTMLQDARQQHIENKRAQQAQKIENQRAEAERELAEQRAQDEALQAYLDQMGSLLLERDLRSSKEDSEVRTLARARTLTVLGRLDPSRKTAVMQFLVEAELVQRVAGRDPIIMLAEANLSNTDLPALWSNIDLQGADLQNANLQGANVQGANLGGANLRHADLHGAELRWADLPRANLRYANLQGADLVLTYLLDANLSNANLSNANLSNAFLLDANLREAYLSGADLSEDNLSSADLSNANLKDADLSGAEGISNEELQQQAASLEGATMPNGQRYEEWLKDKKAREEGR